MKHKYTFRECIMASIVFCVFLYALSIPYQKYLMYGYQYEEVYSKIQAIKEEKEDSIDVVYVGNSQAWAAYSPIQMFGEYGFTSLNCATAGQFPPDAYCVLKEMFKSQKPKVVVLDANMIYSSLNYVKSILINIFPIFHYHNAIKMNVRADYFLMKGFNMNPNVVFYTGRSDYMNQKLESKISLNNKNTLNEIVNICNENDSRLVFVSTTSPLCCSNDRHEMISLFCENNNIEFIDYNDDSLRKEIGIDFNTDFRDDGDHLNLSGSKKICTHLGKKLKDTYQLEDHRNNSKYQDWNELYANTGEYQS